MSCPEDPVGRIVLDGETFRDLDHDGVVSPYEDWRLEPADRARDLLGRLTLAEKVGLLLHGTAPSTGRYGPLGVGPEYDLDAVRKLVLDDGVTSLITRLSLPPAELAAQNNALQAVAAEGRLGIPVMVSTDPRSHFKPTTGASVAAAGFSQWPETLGLAAIGDAALVRRFAEIVRQEYRAVGIHMALSPQADLTTSPRWPRIEGCFGESPDLVRRLVGAYVEGMQGGPSGVTAGGVACVVKHWVGYGASRDGFDGHNYYGRFSAFPGGAFDDHVDAFRDAFAAGVSGVMPTYNILEGVELDGAPLPPVGAGFSRPLLSGLLRRDLGYQGVILSDWAIRKDCNEACRTGQPAQALSDIGMSWGVEHLSALDRIVLGIEAGLDQFGGEDDPAPLMEAVASGRVSEARIDQSVLRLLIQKFELGIFEQPFVDTDEAGRSVGKAEFTAEAGRAQRQAFTWLKGRGDWSLGPQDRVYVHGLPADGLAARGVSVTDDPATATRAVFRIAAPFQTLHPTFFFGRLQHEGDLDFKPGAPDFEAFRAVAARVPTLVSVHLDRPAILTGLTDLAEGLLAEFGADEAAFWDVVCGSSAPCGRLPFALPASMDAVLAGAPDRPLDDPAPLFAFGYGQV